MVENNIDNEFIIELWETIENFVLPKYKIQCIKEILKFLESKGVDIEFFVSDLFNYSVVMDRAIESFLKEREESDDFE